MNTEKHSRTTGPTRSIGSWTAKKTGRDKHETTVLETGDVSAAFAVMAGGVLLSVGAILARRRLRT